MTTVATTQQFQQAIQQGIDPRAIKVDNPNARDAKAMAIQAERQRCKSIIELAGETHRSEARHAIETGMTLETLGMNLFQKQQSQVKASTEGNDQDDAVSAIASRWQE